MRIANWKTKATDAYLEYVFIIIIIIIGATAQFEPRPSSEALLLIAFPRQEWLSEICLTLCLYVRGLSCNSGSLLLFAWRERANNVLRSWQYDIYMETNLICW
jgi:hypothetical protein